MVVEYVTKNEKRKKLVLLLIHGTWSSGTSWASEGSIFHDRILSMLNRTGYEVEDFPFVWSGNNRWKARDEVTKFLNKRIARLDMEDSEKELLIVAHSHGGNIAIDAVRDRLKASPDLPIKGVVCMNTPFLKQQVRSSVSYLKIWLLILLSFLAMQIGLPKISQKIDTSPEALPEIFWPFIHIEKDIFLWACIAIIVVICAMFALSRRLGEDEASLPWEPRPNVLCLSCADDEAITALGLGEGIANLAQLLLHPFMIIVCLLCSLFLFLPTQDVKDLHDFGRICNDFYNYLQAVFIAWMLIAIISNVAGALMVSFLFGLGWRKMFQSLVSRVLVSYTPLGSSRSFFRGINDLKGRFLLHSSIYDSEQTIQEIETWLTKIEAK